MTGLKPCPFCGCEMVLRPTLMCDTCEVGNPCLYCKHEFEEKAQTGHWICGLSWKCSECGYEDDRALGTDFCPNCGARMVEEQESEKSEDYYRGAQEEY